MKNKKSDIVIVVLFLLFIYGIAAVNFIAKDRQFSPMENRMLAQKPKLSAETLLNGKYMEQYETYITDQFIARDAFIRVKSLGERALGKKENHGVYYGRDGYLAEALLTVDETQLEKNMDAVRRFDENTDISISFALIPGSVEINRDKLPSFLPDVNQKAVIEELYQKLDGTDVTCVDVYGMLSAHSQEPLYYRTDHHWTTLGAYYGYQAFMEAKGEEAVPISDYTKKLRTNQFYGTLYSKTGAFWIAPDRILTYVEPENINVWRMESTTLEEANLYEEKWLQEKDKYSMFLGGNQPLGVIKTGATNLTKLLVIRDSYMDSMVPFLTPHYSEIYLLDFRYNRSDVKTFMEENEIDEVLICYSLANFHKDKNVGFMLK